MTLRTFRNPEIPGPHARTVRMGDVTIEPGESAEIDLPRLQVWAHSSPDGSGGDLLGEIDQRCPDLLEEINAPSGLLFDLGEAAPEQVAPEARAEIAPASSPPAEPAEE